MSRVSHVVKVRTRKIGGAGQVCWTPWKTVEGFRDYYDAQLFTNAPRFKAGLQQVAVFFKGKPYREISRGEGRAPTCLWGQDALAGREVVPASPPSSERDR